MWRLSRSLNTRTQTLTSATTPITPVIMIDPTVRESLHTLEMMLQGTVEKIDSDRPTDFHKVTVWHQNSKYTIYNIYNPLGTIARSHP